MVTIPDRANPYFGSWIQRISAHLGRQGTAAISSWQQDHVMEGAGALHITADLEAERGQRQGSYVTFKVSPQ